YNYYTHTTYHYGPLFDYFDYDDPADYDYTTTNYNQADYDYLLYEYKYHGKLLYRATKYKYNHVPDWKRWDDDYNFQWHQFFSAAERSEESLFAHYWQQVDAVLVKRRDDWDWVRVNAD